jgi:hypothetical protein
MADSHPVKMPPDPNVALMKTPEGIQHNIPEYRAAIGSLMYAAIGTKPEIAYAVQKLSQYTSNPSPEHWTAIKQVFHYLKGAQSSGIIYGTSDEPTEPVGYSDADWGSNSDDQKLISGHIFMLAGGPISWQSKKQPMVALLSMEAEYMAASLATHKALWLRTLFTELGLPYSGPTTLYVDN